MELVGLHIDDLRTKGKLAQYVSLTMAALFSFQDHLRFLKTKHIYGCFGLKRAQVQAFVAELAAGQHRLFESNGLIVTVYHDSAVMANATTVFERVKSLSTHSVNTSGLVQRFSDSFLWMLLACPTALEEDVKRLCLMFGVSVAGKPHKQRVAALGNVSEAELDRRMQFKAMEPPNGLIEAAASYVSPVGVRRMMSHFNSGLLASNPRIPMPIDQQEDGRVLSIPFVPAERADDADGARSSTWLSEVISRPSGTAEDDRRIFDLMLRSGKAPRRNQMKPSVPNLRRLVTSLRLVVSPDAKLAELRNAVVEYLNRTPEALTTTSTDSSNLETAEPATPIDREV